MPPNIRDNNSNSYQGYYQQSQGMPRYLDSGDLGLTLLGQGTNDVPKPPIDPGYIVANNGMSGGKGGRGGMGGMGGQFGRQNRGVMGQQGSRGSANFNTFLGNSRQGYQDRLNSKKKSLGSSLGSTGTTSQSKNPLFSMPNTGQNSLSVNPMNNFFSGSSQQSNKNPYGYKF